MAPIVLKLVATLSCQVVILHHPTDNDVHDTSAVFVAMYAVGISSCNLALIVIVVVSHTANVDNAKVNVFHKDVIIGAGQAVWFTEIRSSHIASKSSNQDIVNASTEPLFSNVIV